MRDALGQAVAHRGYLLLSAGYFVCGFQTLFVATHFPVMLRAYDVSPEMGAWSIALIGLFNVIGCLIWGALGGRRRKKHLLAWIYIGRSVVMTAFILLPVSDASVAIFASVIGILWLGTVPLTGGLVAQIFGTRYMATLFGLTFFVHQLGSFIGIWAAVGCTRRPAATSSSGGPRSCWAWLPQPSTCRSTTGRSSAGPRTSRLDPLKTIFTGEMPDNGSTLSPSGYARGNVPGRVGAAAARRAGRREAQMRLRVS